MIADVRRVGRGRDFAGPPCVARGGQLAYRRIPPSCQLLALCSLPAELLTVAGLLSMTNELSRHRDEISDLQYWGDI